VHRWLAGREWKYALRSTSRAFLKTICGSRAARRHAECFAAATHRRPWCAERIARQAGACGV